MKQKFPFNQMPEIRIPELNKLKRKFKQLLSIDCSELNPKQTIDLLFDTFGIIYRPIHLNSWETCSGLKAYRVISEDDIKNIPLPLNSVKSFSYPDNPNLGRANLPGFPVLYASDNAHTAIFEKIYSDPESYYGKQFYLSEWSLKPETNMNTIMLLYGILEPDHFYYEIAKGIFDKLQETMKIYSKEGRNSLEFIASSLGGLFKQKNYHLSSVLANNWLYTNRESEIVRVDCLMYPSVQKDKTGINYAFHPEFVEKYMYISSLQKVELDNFRMEGLNFSLKEIGVINNQSVTWHEVHYTIKRVDLLNKELKSIKTFNQQEVYESTFGFEGEEPFRLPDKLIAILNESIQKDLTSTLLNKSQNPKPYLIKFDQETEFEGMKAYGMGCYIEYLYEQN